MLLREVLRNAMLYRVEKLAATYKHAFVLIVLEVSSSEHKAAIQAAACRCSDLVHIQLSCHKYNAESGWQ